MNRLLIIACAIACVLSPLHASAASNQLQRGKRVYAVFCAQCHGKKLEGQPNWRQRKPNGRLPAPPHDASGHTWHHSDSDLFAMTKNGMVPPLAPAGYESDMPAWKDTLKDDDIWAVVAYIKSLWPEEQRNYQKEISASATR
ncbi:MAG: cytochrome c [Gammaproteobacteria bacterium]|nr:cytochrome c [Gammaproteobacteria bacterium]